MNLHQFRFIQEATKHNLNLTETAKNLHTSQPGVSKAIIQLEAELGVAIFVRHGKRLQSITQAGQKILQSIEVIQREVQNLRQIGEEFSKPDAGHLSIATTHTQARYVLPDAIAFLHSKYPKIRISIHQGSPAQVAQMLLSGVADVGIATEGLDANQHDGTMISLPCHKWQHVLVVPLNHALAQLEKERPLNLIDLAQHPIVTYHPSFTGRSKIDAAFSAAHLKIDVALEATDSDVIQTYVKTGMGVGIVTELAVKEEPNALKAIPAGHLFGTNTTRFAFKRGSYLRPFVRDFATYLNPNLSDADFSSH